MTKTSAPTDPAVRLGFFMPPSGAKMKKEKEGFEGADMRGRWLRLTLAIRRVLGVSAGEAEGAAYQLLGGDVDGRLPNVNDLFQDMLLSDDDEALRYRLNESPDAVITLAAALARRGYFPAAVYLVTVAELLATPGNQGLEKYRHEEGLRIKGEPQNVITRADASRVLEIGRQVQHLAASYLTDTAG